MKIVFLKGGRLRVQALILAILSILSIFFIYRGVHDIQNKVISLEIEEGSFPNKVKITDLRTAREIYQNIRKADLLTVGNRSRGKYRMILNTGSGKQTYWFDHPGRLSKPGTGRVYRLKDNGACLTDLLKQLDDQSRIGEFITWDEARRIFKKYDKAKVTDVETRMAFWVQRRAGSRHADVQPLTAKDSDIMKKIYGGKWSWKRRAVIVETGGHRIAGSMNGMPHGAGAIRGNKFNGHFCIHFRDSKLHSGRTDAAHQLMVWKAAGTVEQMIAGLAPENLVRVMLTALEQGDYKLAARFIAASPTHSTGEVVEKLKHIDWIAVSDISADKKVPEVIAVKLTYKLSDGTQFKNRLIRFKLAAPSGKGSRKLEPGAVLEMFTRAALQGDDDKIKSTFSSWKVDQEM